MFVFIIFYINASMYYNICSWLYVYSTGDKKDKGTGISKPGGMSSLAGLPSLGMYYSVCTTNGSSAQYILLICA